MAGRPTDYREEFCDMVIEHMGTGKSLASFASYIGTHRATLYDWMKAHPQFHDAFKKAQDKSRTWWESQGHEGLWNVTEFDENTGKPKRVKTINAAIWIFTMKSRFGYSDQPDKAHQASDDAAMEKALEEDEFNQ